MEPNEKLAVALIGAWLQLDEGERGAAASIVLQCVSLLLTPQQSAAKASTTVRRP